MYNHQGTFQYISIFGFDSDLGQVLGCACFQVPEVGRVHYHTDTLLTIACTRLVNIRTMYEVQRAEIGGKPTDDGGFAAEWSQHCMKHPCI